MQDSGTTNTVGISSLDRKRRLLETAISAVCGDRGLNYGLPEHNFDRIAKLWNAWLDIRTEAKLVDKFYIQPWEVSIFNILLKIARLANSPAHHDSWVDIAGYAACGADIVRSEETIKKKPSRDPICVKCQKPIYFDQMIKEDPHDQGHYFHLTCWESSERPLPLQEFADMPRSR